MKYGFLKILSLLALTSQMAMALPQVDASLDIDAPAFGYRPVIYADDTDPDLFYLPYTHIEIMQNTTTGLPDLSIVYQPSGLVFMATVRPSYDPEGTKSLRDLILARRPTARFVPLPLTAGSFAMNIRYSNQQNQPVDVVIPHNKGYVVPHLDPQKPASLMLLFNRQQANLIIMTLMGSGSLALNYEYSYRAAFTPSRARLKFEWSELNEHLPRVPPLGGLTERNLQMFVKDAVENRSIQLEILEGRKDGATLMNQLANFVRERCFLPIASSQGQAQALYAPNAHGCAGTTVSELQFEAPSVGDLKAAAGFSIFQLCQRYPQLIRHKRGNSYFEGCPDRIYSQGEPQAMPVGTRDEAVPAPIVNPME